MGTLSINELMELNKVITEINAHNDNVQIFVRFEEKYLLDISVRFAVPEGVSVSPYKVVKIYDEIVALSNERLIPERDGLLRHGILEIKVSYAKQGCTGDDFIRPLKFIAYDMMSLIMSGD